MLGVGQVLEPVLPEVADRHIGAQQPLGRLREDDLPAVGRGCNPGGAVDVQADVALLGDERLARVEAHADPYRALRERAASLGRGGDSRVGPRERDEERVTLGVDLDAQVPRERVSQDTPVLREEVGIGGSVLLEQPRRALDVGEEERHRSCRQSPPAHAAIIAPMRFDPAPRVGVSPRSRWPRY